MIRNPFRHEYRPGQHRPRDIRNGLIAAALLLFLLTTAIGRRVPFWPHSGKVVSAEFASGINLTKTTPVRVNGVDVGMVESVAGKSDGRGVIVKMRLNKHNVKLHDDASAAVHYRTLLGLNVSVDLNPGSPTGPALGDRPIPLSHTRVQPEVDEVLRPLDATGRRTLQTTVDEFGKGFADTKAVGAATQQMAAGLGALARGLPPLRGERPGVDLPALVKSTSRAMGALSRSEVALGGLIDHADMTLAVTAARGGDIASTLQAAPEALTSTSVTMKRLDTTLDRLHPVAQKLLPGAGELDSSLTATGLALDQLAPLLRDARPSFVDLSSATRVLRDRVAHQGTTLVTRLIPFFDGLDTKIIPFLNAKDSDTRMPNYQSIGPTIAHVDAIGTPWDANGHAVQFGPAPKLDSIQGADCKTSLSDPTVSKILDCRAVLDVVAKLLGQRTTSARKGK